LTPIYCRYKTRRKSDNTGTDTARSAEVRIIDAFVSLSRSHVEIFLNNCPCHNGMCYYCIIFFKKMDRFRFKLYVRYILYWANT
jgi:hypothetical protein